MKRKGFLLALAVVLVANVFVLAGVAYNRGGAPDARLTLTARELPPAWDFGDYTDGGENTGLSLRIEWQNNPDIEKSILTREKLASLGFRFPPVQGKPDGKESKTLLDRKAYVVLEYNGRAWAGLLQARQVALAKLLADARNDAERQRYQKSHDHFERTASRLVLVDVGLDPAALRARYGDGGKYLIAKARVSASSYFRDVQARSTEHEVQGHISELLPDTVYVPRQFHGLIQQPGKPRPRFGWQYDPDSTVLPDYQVTLAYGQRHEPWVEAVTAGPAVH